MTKSTASRPFTVTCDKLFVDGPLKGLTFANDSFTVFGEFDLNAFVAQMNAKSGKTGYTVSNARVAPKQAAA